MSYCIIDYRPNKFPPKMIVLSMHRVLGVPSRFRSTHHNVAARGRRQWGRSRICERRKNAYIPVTVTKLVVRSFHARKKLVARNSSKVAVDPCQPDRRRGTHTPEMLDKCPDRGWGLLIIKLAGDNCRVVEPTLWRHVFPPRLPRCSSQRASSPFLACLRPWDSGTLLFLSSFFPRVLQLRRGSVRMSRDNLFVEISRFAWECQTDLVAVKVSRSRGEFGRSTKIKML